MLIRDIDPNLLSEVAVPIKQSAQIGATAEPWSGNAGVAQIGVDATDLTRRVMRAKTPSLIKPLPYAAVAPMAGDASKLVTPTLSKISPGLGMAASGLDAIKRTAAGDYIGAGISTAAGVASFFPGLGTAAALALVAINIGRDKYRTNNWFANFDDLQKADALEAGMQPGGNPIVFAAQNDLVKQGHKNIVPTGNMDQATEAALAVVAKKAKADPSIWDQVKNAVGLNEDGEQQPTQDQIRDPAFCAANGIEPTIDPALEKDPAFVDAFVAARHYHKSIVKYNGKIYPVYLETDYNGPDAPSGFTVSESSDLARIKLLTRKLLNG